MSDSVVDRAELMTPARLANLFDALHAVVGYSGNGTASLMELEAYVYALRTGTARDVNDALVADLGTGATDGTRVRDLGDTSRSVGGWRRNANGELTAPVRDEDGIRPGLCFKFNGNHYRVDRKHPNGWDVTNLTKGTPGSRVPTSFILHNRASWYQSRVAPNVAPLSTSQMTELRDLTIEDVVDESAVDVMVRDFCVAPDVAKAAVESFVAANTPKPPPPDTSTAGQCADERSADSCDRAWDTPCSWALMVDDLRMGAQALMCKAAEAAEHEDHEEVTAVGIAIGHLHSMIRSCEREGRPA